MNKLPIFSLVFIFISLAPETGNSITLSGDKNSFVQHQNPHCRLNCNISLQFIPRSPHGVLVYLDSEAQSRSYILVYLLDSQLTAVFSSTLSSWVFASHKLADQTRWNQLRIEKVANRLNLVFNSETNSTDIGVQSLFDSLTSPLFVGGIPNKYNSQKLSLPNAFYKPHFAGLIQNVFNSLKPRW